MPYSTLLLRFFDAYARRKFSLREIAKLDLLDPGVTRDWLDRTASKQAQYDIQRELNPAEYWILTEDKSVFYRCCIADGLPVPRYFGCFTVPRNGRPPMVNAPFREQALLLLEGLRGHDLIVKPARGYHGQDVVAFRSDDAGVVGEQKVYRDTGDFLDWLASVSEFETFVVQERLKCHPQLQALSGTSNLQTVRMVTYLRRDRSPVIGGCQLKIIGEDSLVDNFSHGQRSNLLGDIPAAGGRLSRAFLANADGTSQFVDRHPRTGVALDGFRIPFWEDACALVERAAIAFLPLRTIGWDVAITADGPLLIEGNASWDPPQRGGEVNGEILEAMRNDSAMRGRLPFVARSLP